MSDGWVAKEPCPSCGSRDNLRRHSDGHAYCFSHGCGYRERGLMDDSNSGRLDPDGSDMGRNGGDGLTPRGEYGALLSRKIKEETTKHYGYKQGTYKGQPAHFAHYYDDQRRLVAIHVRTPDKDFPWIGEPKKAPLFGQWLYRDGGKRVIVTEGEIDAMSIAEVQGVKWPSVSVPSGASDAPKAFERALDWLEKFEQVIICFDMDEPGRKAAVECAAKLTPGKACIVTLPEGFKDASDMLKGGKGPQLIDALWGAKPYRPDGIIDGAVIGLDDLLEPVKGYAMRLPKLNEMIGGIREGELTLLTAGSGIGKSTLAREVAYALHQDHGLTIGNIYLEENLKKTAQGYVAIHNNVPLGKLRLNPDVLSKDQWEASLKEVIHKRMFFYDHFGSMDSDNLLGKIRYMRVALGCNFVVLDHISIVVSGAEGSGEGERKDIDRLMTKLRSLIEQTGLGIIAIVHLSKPEGRTHEEGGRVTLSQLRGSGSLKQLSDNVIALERDQQDEDKAHVSTARVLKCREFGETGLADTLEYNRETGRLLATEAEPTFADTTQDF